MPRTAKRSSNPPAPRAAGVRPFQVIDIHAHADALRRRTEARRRMEEVAELRSLNRSQWA